MLQQLGPGGDGSGDSHVSCHVIRRPHCKNDRTRSTARRDEKVKR